jgi:hypothetical protein
MAGSNPNRLLQALPGLGLILLGGVLLGRPQEAALPPTIQPLAADGADFSLTAARDAGLFAQLAAGDRAWIPRAELIPGGGTRYVYKKRADEPPLTVDQIKALLRQPPSFEQEQRAIRLLLDALRASGVRLILGPPNKHGAAGEWEPAQAALRIRPDIPAKGSREFARVLNHEAIHVAQSCSNGSIRAQPKPLGLPRSLDQAALRHLKEPLYTHASATERLLEEEAYANQHRLSLGGQLVEVHCRG